MWLISPAFAVENIINSLNVLYFPFREPTPIKVKHKIDCFGSIRILQNG
jgi:hypothetical protein